MTRTKTSKSKTTRDYTDAEFSKALIRTQGTNALSVTFRVLTIAGVYGLLAHWISSKSMSTWLLLVPMAFEFVLMMWLGFFLTRFAVTCPVFAQTANKPIAIVIWTVLTLAAFALIAGFDDTYSTWQWQWVPHGLSNRWQELLAFKMPWALAWSALGLIASTALDLQYWKTHGGVFVWTSIFQIGFRIGVIFLLGFFSLFAAILMPFLLSAIDFKPNSKSLTWAVFWFLLVVEVLTVLIALGMTRDAKKKYGHSPTKA